MYTSNRRGDESEGGRGVDQQQPQQPPTPPPAAATMLGAVRRVLRDFESEQLAHPAAGGAAAAATTMNQHDSDDEHGDLRAWTALEAAAAISAEESACVSFDTSINVHLVPSLSDLSQDEHDATWYTEREWQKFQVEIVRTIKAARRCHFSATASTSGLLENEGLCLRGIEHMTSPEELRRRKKIKADVIRAVLNEQRRQRMAGGGAGYDPEATRRASARISATSTDLALEAGKSDATFARLEVAASMTAARSSAGSLTHANLHPTRPPPPFLLHSSANLYDVLSRALETARSPSSAPTSSPALAR